MMQWFPQAVLKGRVFRALALSAAWLIAIDAQAVPFVVTPSLGDLNSTRWQGNQTSQSQINNWLNNQFGSGFTGTQLYKQDVGSAESGTLAGSYETSFNPTTEPEDADILYTGGPTGNIAGPTAYLLVKDGNNSPAWYLYNLSGLGWNGSDDLWLRGFWVGGGAISHVTLYGTSIPKPPPGGGGTNVPDGGTTLGLLGLAIIGLRLAQRQVRATGSL